MDNEADSFEIDYLTRRVAEELAWADQSDDPIAAETHRRLAALYGSKLSDLRIKPTIPTSGQAS